MAKKDKPFEKMLEKISDIDKKGFDQWSKDIKVDTLIPRFYYISDCVAYIVHRAKFVLGPELKNRIINNLIAVSKVDNGSLHATSIDRMDLCNLAVELDDDILKLWLVRLEQTVKAWVSSPSEFGKLLELETISVFFNGIDYDKDYDEMAHWDRVTQATRKAFNAYHVYALSQGP